MAQDKSSRKYVYLVQIMRKDQYEPIAAFIKKHDMEDWVRDELPDNLLDNIQIIRFRDGQPESGEVEVGLCRILKKRV